LSTISGVPLGDRTLLINPPLVGGIAFTRQGRCQEREEVLGTTKPPLTLALLAALLRNQGHKVRLADLTASRVDIDQFIATLDAEGFSPTLILFPSTTPTLDADVVAMARLKARYGAPIFCFGPHASTTPGESMARASQVDGMVVGEPEDAALALAALPSLDGLGTIPSLTYRTGGQVFPHRAHGTYTGFMTAPLPAWDLLDLSTYSLPLVNKPYAIVETSRGCPYSCDFCVAPIHQGHKFRERSAASIVDEMARMVNDFGVRFFYLWGDTVTLNVKSFSALCEEIITRGLDVQWLGNARADNLQDPVFVDRLKRSGCWMLALGIETESDETRKTMMKKLESEKIRRALRNLRDARIRSFAFFILGYPGEDAAALERTIDYALELDPDFANFYPAVPYPGTELYNKVRLQGMLVSEDWVRMEYSHYLLEGNGLNETVVMDAIRRARRRFFMRPRYLTRHFGDLLRLVVSRPRIALEAGRQMLLGRPRTDAPEPSPTVPVDVRVG
jgi:anaerobic magnesium-protoporphyrin IX monomethyl ester cyclase